MAAPVWLRGGSTLYWIDPDRGVLSSSPIDPDPVRAAGLLADGWRNLPPDRWVGWVRRTASISADASEELRAAALARNLRLPPVNDERLQAARRLLPIRSVAEERRFLLALAHSACARALSDPVETLIAFSREEARVERALGRESGAAAQWIAVPSTPLAGQAESQRRFGDQFVQYHRELEQRVDEAAWEVVPNLSRLLGPKVAGRLIAAAGSRATLARSSSARLQLLGARRRPKPDGGPRYGVLYRAPGLEELPHERQGRYARSLAALAAIAVRADHYTRADLGMKLVERRDRRLRSLREGTP